MNKIPPSSSSPQPRPSETKEKSSTQKWLRVWGRFIYSLGKNLVRSFTPNLLKKQPKATELRDRTIEHLTTLSNTEMSKAEIFTLAQAGSYEREGKIIKAKWLRAKASEKIFVPDEELIQHFRKLNGGAEGAVALVFKGLAGPLLVQKKLYSGDSEESKAEIALLQRLDHPNIIKVLPNENPTQHDEATHIMKNGGVSLKNLILAGKNENERPLPPPLFISIAKQMADALVYLKEEKVLHRDIKPENIAIDPTGQISLIDFGMAFDGKTNTACSPYGFGTPSYMEPDACSRYAGIKYSATADMFATGQTLFQLLTGGKVVFPEFYEKQLLSYGSERASWDAYKKDLSATKAIAPNIAKALKGQPKRYIQQVTDLVTRMLEPDPKLRITPEEFKNHPLFHNKQPSSWKQALLKKLPILRSPFSPRSK